MKITLTQDNIIAGVKAFLASQGLDASNADISFTVTRKPTTQVTAEVDLNPAPVLVAASDVAAQGIKAAVNSEPVVVEKPDEVGTAGEAAGKSAEPAPEVAPVAADEAAPAETEAVNEPALVESEAAPVETNSLFG